MNRSKSASYMMLAALTLFVGVRAQAQDYYTVEQVRRCENQGSNTAGGVFGGLLVGGILGGLLTRGSAGGIAAGAIAGGATGGILGHELSCEDQTVYVQHVDDYLRYAPEEGYSDDRCHVVVIGSGYASTGHVCRTYHMDYWTSHGWVPTESTACWVNGQWRHGYDADVISRRVYVNPRPRFYYEVEDRLRDRQRMYWARRSERETWERQHERDRAQWAFERERSHREREMRYANDRQEARETVRDIQRERREERVQRYDNRRDDRRDDWRDDRRDDRRDRRDDRQHAFH